MKIKQRNDKETCNSLSDLLRSKYSKENEQHGNFLKEKAGVNFELERSEDDFKFAKANLRYHTLESLILAQDERWRRA